MDSLLGVINMKHKHEKEQENSVATQSVHGYSPVATQSVHGYSPVATQSVHGYSPVATQSVHGYSPVATQSVHGYSPVLEYHGNEGVPTDFHASVYKAKH